MAASDIGAVVVSTCTGYLCPGLSGYVAEALGLRQDGQHDDQHHDDEVLHDGHGQQQAAVTGRDLDCQGCGRGA